MAIAITAFALAAGIAGETREAPLFELVPVRPEYAAAAPGPIPTPAVTKARRKIPAKTGGRPYPPRRNAPPMPSPPPMPLYIAPPAPVMMPPPIPTPPPPRRPAGSRAVPRGAPSSWVVEDDYPAVALRENMQGKVGFVLDVDSAGRVSDCHVVRSSGWPVLDQTTCALLRRRARFLPAIDSSGVPTSGTWSSRFYWKMPLDAISPMASWARVTRFAVNGGGEIMGCFTREFGSPPAAEAGRCDQQPDEQDLEALLGDSRGSRSVELVETQIADGGAPPEGFVMPQGKAVAAREMRLTIAEEGYVRGCEPGASERPDLLQRYADPCAPAWTYPAAVGVGERFMTLRISFVRH